MEKHLHFIRYAALGALITLVLSALCLLGFCAASVPRASAEAFKADYEVLLESKCGKLISHDTISCVELYGTYSDKSLFAHDVRLIVKDPATAKVLAEIKPPQNAGYNPSFILGNFTGKSTEQIFLGINSGGSGGFGFFYVYDFTNGELKTIFDFEKTGLNYSAAYADNYKVVVKNETTGKSYSTDVSYKGKDYLDELYNADGTLKKPVEAQVYPVTTVFPYYNTAVSKYQLEVISPVSGLYHADGIGSVITLMDYSGNGFKPYYEMFAAN